MNDGLLVRIVCVLLECDIDLCQSLFYEEESFDILLDGNASVSLHISYRSINDDSSLSQKWLQSCLRRLHTFLHPGNYFVLNLHLALLMSKVYHTRRQPLRKVKGERESVLSYRRFTLRKSLNHCSADKKTVFADDFALVFL